MKSAVALVLCLATAALAAEVVVFGDSWGAFSEDQFQDMFTSRGYDIIVDNRAIGGTTARFWSRDPESLLDFVKANPDCKWIWLSIGGNDAMFELVLQRDIEKILADALNNTAALIEPVIAYNPEIQIVQFGYDIVDLGSPGCNIFGTVMMPWCGNNITCRNHEMFRLQYDYVDTLSRMYPDNHVSVNVLGTLQSLRPDEVPGPYPNADYYSPLDVMRDCIHANDEGFTGIFDVMWDQYWVSQVNKLRTLKH